MLQPPGVTIGSDPHLIMPEKAVEAEAVTKSFGKVHALVGVDLEVRRGTVLALLGPNGAGKTTLVRVLTTLLKPDSGWARVAGLDVVRDAARVRSIIGLAGQYAAVDENLTGRENLWMFGRLYHLGSAEARRKADDLLERFDLTGAADRRAKTYSGGMRRRLDLAACLVGNPAMLFMDEPTTGLDPRSRLGMWDVIRRLVSEGATLVLTTQYLDEADQLAHRIAVTDRGRIIAEGTSDELKSRVGGDVVQLTVSDRAKTGEAASAIASVGSGTPAIDAAVGTVTLPVSGGASVLPEVVRRLDAAHLAIKDIVLRRPTLDDVFLALTGHAAEDAPTDGAAQGKRTRRGSDGGRTP